MRRVVTWRVSEKLARLDFAKVPQMAEHTLLFEMRQLARRISAFCVRKVRYFVHYGGVKIRLVVTLVRLIIDDYFYSVQLVD